MDDAPLDFSSGKTRTKLPMNVRSPPAKRKLFLPEATGLTSAQILQLFDQRLPLLAATASSAMPNERYGRVLFVG